ncbi:MAG: Ig-like domain repeat protein, partial [Bacteroidales bacterium]|nr:Ig-like domain repeat protein [Bacteroidales bacterium]
KAQSVIITNSEFSGNTTTLDGGAISVNIGTLDVEGTTFSKNKATAATGNGGAIGLFGSAGDTNISGSTFSDNEAGSDGGGIYTTASEVTLTNSTISGNQADNGGGVGLGAAGKFTSQNSTIAFNTATTKGGGVNVPSGGVFMTTSSIIAMNSGGDVDGEAQSGGNNLFGDDTGLTITGGTDDLTNVDPKLAPLADNGGSTFTHALMNDSPALNAGSNTESLTTDQRGDGFLRVAGGVADIGAFEVQQVDTQTTLTVDTTNASFGDPVTFTATVTIADTETPAAGTVTFADANGNVLGTADLDENGVATLTLSDLLPGTTSVTASYAAADGDTFFQPSESDAVDVTITTPFPQGSSFGAGAGGGQAILQDNTGAVLQTVTPFGADFTGGVRVATADFNGDGTPDIVVGNGPGVASKVVVIDGKSGETLFEVAPFEASFTGGVFVAAGDINKDGVPELVITPDQGGGPRVQVYDGGAQFTKIADFYGITDPDFRGGARAAVADIDGDGFGDLIVSAGFEGGPRVAVWNGTTIAEDSTPEKLISDIFVFEDTLRNGAFVTGADIDGDGKAELIAGAGPGGGPRIVAFNGADLLNGQQTLVANFFAGNPDNRNGVPVGVVDYNGDGEPDLLTGTGEPLPGTMGGESTATIYAASGLSDATPTPLDSLEPFPGFTGGVFVG